LSITPPVSLQGHEIAITEWTRVLSVPGHKITAFDQDLLVNYCLVFEEEQAIAIHIMEAIADMPNIEQMQKRLRDKRKLLTTLARSLYVTPPQIKLIDSALDAVR